MPMLIPLSSTVGRDGKIEKRFVTIEIRNRLMESNGVQMERKEREEREDRARS